MIVSMADEMKMDSEGFLHQILPSWVCFRSSLKFKESHFFEMLFVCLSCGIQNQALKKLPSGISWTKTTNKSKNNNIMTTSLNHPPRKMHKTRLFLIYLPLQFSTMFYAISSCEAWLSAPGIFWIFFHKFTEWNILCFSTWRRYRDDKSWLKQKSRRTFFIKIFGT
jgi:hypothetical protein